MVQEAQAESATQVALVEYILESSRFITLSNNAPPVTVALAVIGVRGAEATSQDGPVLALQQQTNEALEWTKALAPTVGGLVSGLGVAAINASVTKNAQNANRAIHVRRSTAERSHCWGRPPWGHRQVTTQVFRLAVMSIRLTIRGSLISLRRLLALRHTMPARTIRRAIHGFINNGSNIAQLMGKHLSNERRAGRLLIPVLFSTLGALIDYLANLVSRRISLTIDGAVVASNTNGSGETVAITCNSVMFSPRPAQCT